MVRWNLQVSACLAALLVAGCAAPTRIASNKASTYTTTPSRIFIITDIGSEWGAEYANAFEQKFSDISKACGVSIRLSKISSLELDDTARQASMKSFEPDALLAIRRNGGTISGATVINMRYDLRLADPVSNKVVWRADASVVRGAYLPMAQRGETVAIEISNKMKADGLYGNCAPVAIPGPGAK